MKHEKVKSTNIHSLAHDGDILEARFKCGKCGGEGSVKVRDFAGVESTQGCSTCNGAGHGPTYRYLGVPKELHDRVLAGDHGIEGRKASVGTAFMTHIRSNKDFKVEKL